MQFESFSEFIHMGGHGTFIWSVYLITAVVILVNVLLPLRQKRQFFLDQVARSKREATAQASPTPEAGRDGQERESRAP
jgi:heme exporter protein D